MSRVEAVCLWCSMPLDGSPRTWGIEYRVIGYTPCAKCRELFAKGVAVIECSRTPTNDRQPSFGTGVPAYPTGRYMVVSDAVAEWLTDKAPEKERKDVMAARKLLMTPEDFSKFVAFLREQGFIDRIPDPSKTIPKHLD